MMVFCVCIFYILVYTSACGEASFDSSCDFLFYLRHYSQTATSVDPHLARMDFTRARCGSDLGQHNAAVWVVMLVFGMLKVQN